MKPETWAYIAIAIASILINVWGFWNDWRRERER
jgi:hypothetical protein